MIDFLSQWVHADVALAIVMAINIVIFAGALMICAEALGRPLSNNHALLLSLTIILGSFVPSDSETVNYYNMAVNRLTFGSTCYIAIMLVQFYGYISGIIRKKDTK